MRLSRFFSWLLNSRHREGATGDGENEQGLSRALVSAYAQTVLAASCPSLWAGCREQDLDFRLEMGTPLDAAGDLQRFSMKYIPDT